MNFKYLYANIKRESTKHIGAANVIMSCPKSCVSDVVLDVVSREAEIFFLIDFAKLDLLVGC